MFYSPVAEMFVFRRGSVTLTNDVCLCIAGLQLSIRLQGKDRQLHHFLSTAGQHLHCIVTASIGPVARVRFSFVLNCPGLFV